MANEAMREYWGQNGKRWVRDREALDLLLSPFLTELLEAVDVRAGESVLDVGCGAGTTTLELARRAAPGGRVVGVDVSEPLLAELCDRIGDAGATIGSAIRPLLADAQVEPLPGPFDVVTSRFGVMFFDDQDAAWRNIRAAARPGARLAFVCWQDAEDNPWSRIPALAALAVSPSDDPLPEPGAPGPNALADPERTQRILTEAGWRGIDCAPIVTTVNLGPNMATALDHVRGQRSVGGAIERAGEAPVLDAVAAALAPYADAVGAIHLDAAIWVVTARA